MTYIILKLQYGYQYLVNFKFHINVYFVYRNFGLHLPYDLDNLLMSK